MSDSYPSTGFPDYSRLNPEGGRYLATLRGVINTNPATPAISSAGFRYIILQTTGNTVGTIYDVIINWGFNSDGGIRFASTYYTPNTGNSNQIVLPVMGEWFTVEYFYQSGAGTQQPATYIYGTNEAPVVAPLGSFGGGFHVFNGVVGSGATQVDDVAGIHMGKATVGFANNATSQWFGLIAYLNSGLGTYQALYRFDGATFNLACAVEVILPPAPIQISVNNTSAGGTGFTMSLVPG